MHAANIFVCKRTLLLSIRDSIAPPLLATVAAAIIASSLEAPEGEGVSLTLTHPGMNISLHARDHKPGIAASKVHGGHLHHGEVHPFKGNLLRGGQAEGSGAAVVATFTLVHGTECFWWLLLLWGTVVDAIIGISILSRKVRFIDRARWKGLYEDHDCGNGGGCDGDVGSVDGEEGADSAVSCRVHHGDPRVHDQIVKVFNN